MSRILLVLILLTGLLSGCGESGPGSVAGQIVAASADGEVRNIAGAQVVLRGERDTRTTVSNDVPNTGQGSEGSTNYRIENVPPGTYRMAVTPPPGSGLQPEADITLNVEAGEVFPQSVVLLAEGIAKPRPLAPSELNPGEVGYVNGRGERVVHERGSGLDTSDFLLMYLLMRNPPAYGYGAPPIIINNPGASTAGTSRYRVEPPPRTTQGGQRVTQRPPSVPGQGSTRPGAAPASGSGPSVGGGRPPEADGAGSTARPPSSNGSSPNGSSGVGPSSSAPSQGVTRPSGSAPRPSAPAPSRPSGGSRSSGGGRK